MCKEVTAGMVRVLSSAAVFLQLVLTIFMFPGEGLNVSALRVGYSSCKAILNANRNASSGDYTLTTSAGRTLAKVYCEMGLNGGGYTFLHPSDIQIMTKEEVQSMFTDTTTFLLRVRLSNGAQPYGILKQLPVHSSRPLALFLNSSPGYNAPVNSAANRLGSNYLYFGFVPLPIPVGTTQGLEVNGVPVSFRQGDLTQNSYLALFPNNAESIPPAVGSNSYTWPMYSSLLSALRQNPSMRVISDDYFTFFEGHFGGGGLYVHSGPEQARYPQPDLAGNRNVYVISMAIGFK